MKTYQHVLVETRDGIATVTLNNPARLNPLSIALQSELLQAIDQIRRDDSIHALVLTGAGKGFCVGADLNSMTPATLGNADRSVGESVAELMARWTNPMIMALRELPVPVLSVVNGPAAGAGVGLALAADVVLAARSAYFYLPFMPALGIVPDAGTTWFLPRMAGWARAVGLALLGDRLSATDAAAWGLIWACVEDGELSAETSRIGERLAALPAHAAMEIRRMYDHSAVHTLGEQLDYERHRQRELIDGPWFAEGVKAFSEKRKPLFRHT